MKAKPSVAHFHELKSPGHQENCIVSLPDHGIYAITDGFGIAEAALKASETCIDTIANFLKKKMDQKEITMPLKMNKSLTMNQNAVWNALQLGNQTMLQMNEKKSVHESGGCSAFVAYQSGRELTLGSVGDCEAYLIRNRNIIPLVVAQTLHFESAIPVTSLGVQVDIWPQISSLRIQAGDFVIGSNVRLPIELLHSWAQQGLAQGRLKAIEQWQQRLKDELLAKISELKKEKIGICLQWAS